MRRPFATLGLAGGLLLAAGLPADAQKARATTATVEASGLSAERLQRLSAAIGDEVKAGTIPGALVVIGRKGRTAQAIRSVVRAVGAIDDTDVHVDIVD